MAKAGEGVDGLTVLCSAHCADNSGDLAVADAGDEDEEELHAPPPRPPGRPREGPVIFHAEPTLPLLDQVIRRGEVLHLNPEDGQTFRPVHLSLHPNGMCIVPSRPGDTSPILQVAWSPFSLVQACRLHTMQADESQPFLRLFKVSIFHHGLTHFFATQGEKADSERARWVADVSRCLRVLTASLFPPFSIRTEPHPGASWTGTRLLAGYLLLYDELGVSRIYGELHAHWDNHAAFAAYEDDCCDVQVCNLAIDMGTCVSDRVGIDCSCFSLGDHHFSARSCAEKMLWLRAISNVKVKLRHWASNPSRGELRHYRAAIREHVQSLAFSVEDPHAPSGPLLPRRRGPPSLKPPICSGIDDGRSPSSSASFGGSWPGGSVAEPGSPSSAVPPAPPPPAGTSAALMAAAAARLSQTRQPARGPCPEPLDDALPPPGAPPGHEAPAVTRQAQLMAPLVPGLG